MHIVSFLPTISHKCHLRSLLLRHVLRTGCHLCCIISEALWILGYYPLPLWLWYVLFFPDKFLWINPSPWRWPRLPQISFCWQNIMRTLWASSEEFDSNPLTISSWSHCYVTSPYDHHFVQWTPYVCPQDTSESCEKSASLMFLNPEFIYNGFPEISQWNLCKDQWNFDDPKDKFPSVSALEPTNFW